MKITIFSHIWHPGLYTPASIMDPSCKSYYKEVALLPGNIESWSEWTEENKCNVCGKDEYLGKFHITTKSGQQYTIIENPEATNLAGVSLLSI